MPRATYPHTLHSGERVVRQSSLCAIIPEWLLEVVTEAAREYPYDFLPARTCGACGSAGPLYRYVRVDSCGNRYPDGPLACCERHRTQE